MSSKTDYWLELCDDDLITAKALLDSKRLLHTGFFCHAVAEKALKAIIADITNEVPPKIHDLGKLAIRGGIDGDLSDEQNTLLDDLGPMQIEARYPDYKAKIAQTLTYAKVKQMLTETEAFLCWIKQRLGK